MCRNLIGTKIPIQLELSYKSDEGSDVIRVIRIYKEVTDDDKIVEKSRYILSLFNQRFIKEFIQIFKFDFRH